MAPVHNSISHAGCLSGLGGLCASYIACLPGTMQAGDRGHYGNSCVVHRIKTLRWLITCNFMH